jgi:hypothetical protein
MDRVDDGLGQRLGVFDRLELSFHRMQTVRARRA